MKTLYSTVALSCLSILLATGCGPKNQDTTTPPDDSAGAEAGDGDGDGENGDEAGGDGDGDAEAGGDGDSDAPAGGVKECDAEVSDTPAAFFADRLLVRLPKGVEIVERNEIFAQVPNRNQQSACEVIVTNGALGYFQADAAKEPTATRDEIVTQIGYQVSDVTWSDETPQGRNYFGHYEVPGDDKGNPPVAGYMTLKEVDGTLFWYILETHPNAYPAIKKTFMESGKRLFVVPAS